MSTLLGETNQYQILRHSDLMFSIFYMRTDRQTDRQTGILMPKRNVLDYKTSPAYTKQNLNIV